MVKQLYFPLLITEDILTHCYKGSALVNRPTVRAAKQRCSMACCTFLWFGSMLTWGKEWCIFTDPCAHQQFWCRSTRTIRWVYVILQSWGDQQWVQNLYVRKRGFMTQGEELAGFLASEISIKGVCFVLRISSQLPQSATGTCCSTRVSAKQLVDGWWWQFRAVFKRVRVQSIGFVNMPEVDHPRFELLGCFWISVKHMYSLFVFLRKASLLVLLFYLTGTWTGKVWPGIQCKDINGI